MEKWDVKVKPRRAKVLMNEMKKFAKDQARINGTGWNNQPPFIGSKIDDILSENGIENRRRTLSHRMTRMLKSWSFLPNTVTVPVPYLATATWASLLKDLFSINGYKVDE